MKQQRKIPKSRVKLPTSALTFAPPKQVVFSDTQACRYLGLDIGRENDMPAQLRALDRLVYDRKLLKATKTPKQLLKSMVYRTFRTYHLDDLDDFLQRMRK